MNTDLNLNRDLNPNVSSVTGMNDFSFFQYFSIEEIEKISKANPNDMSFGTAIRRELLKRKR